MRIVRLYHDIQKYKVETQEQGRHIHIEEIFWAGGFISISISFGTFGMYCLIENFLLWKIVHINTNILTLILNIRQ